MTLFSNMTYTQFLPLRQAISATVAAAANSSHGTIAKAVRSLSTSKVSNVTKVSSSAAAFPAHVRIVEVGPRDGLQNEKATVATKDKVG